MIYDISIVGAGPAGMMAAIYAVRKGYQALLISKDVGGPVGISGEIENYLGFSSIDGSELVRKFKEHVSKFEVINLIEGKEIIKITNEKNLFQLFDKEKNEYKAKSVIICTGREPRWLGIPGEAQFKGRGVSACATCDAPFFRNKEVIVVGGGNSGLEAAGLLSKFAAKIIVMTNVSELTGDKVLIDSVTNDEKISIIYDTILTEINGSQLVESVSIINTKTEAKKIIKTNGVFVEIGYQPPAKIEELTIKDDDGAIKVNSDFETNIPGFFAAGDSNNLWGEQIIIAAGEGAKAAMVAAKYLSLK